MSREQITEERRSRPDKVCFGCDEKKPRPEFRATKKSSDGMVAKCRECEADWHRQHYAENREVILARGREWYQANTHGKADQNRRWREANVEKRRAASRAYYAANPEKFAEKRRRDIESGVQAARVRDWRQRNRDHANAQAREWKAKNRDRLNEAARRRYAENAEKFREEARRWRAANREELRDYWHNRRKTDKRYVERANARRARMVGTQVGPIDLDALWREQGGRCGLCGDPIDRELRFPHPLSPSQDHVMPLSKGGTHTQDNLQWAHLFCNVSKGASLPPNQLEAG